MTIGIFVYLLTFGAFCALIGGIVADYFNQRARREERSWLTWADYEETLNTVERRATGRPYDWQRDGL